jgi:hypothetical protein
MRNAPAVGEEPDTRSTGDISALHFNDKETLGPDDQEVDLSNNFIDVLRKFKRVKTTIAGAQFELAEMLKQVSLG